MNTSYSREAVEIARRANPKLNVQQRRILREALQGTLTKPVNETFGYFSRQSRQEFLQRFEGSNQAIANRHFAGDETKLFPAVGCCQEESRRCGDVSVEVGDGIAISQVAELVSKAISVSKEKYSNNEPSQPRQGSGFLAWLKNVIRRR